MHAAKRLALAGLLVTAGAFAHVLVFAQGPQGPQAPPDIVGEWRLDTSERDTATQAPLGDYTGIPFNDAGRMRSETTPESIWSTAEYQCRPHSAPHQWRGLGGARILAEQDPITRNVSVYHVQFMRSLDRPIFMDGRSHPPAYAPHSWTGFSTGEWIGNTLKVTTTHLKDGYLRRGGPQTTDLYAMTEYITRHDDILSIVTVIDDPLYQDQPYIHSTTYTYDPTLRVNTENCNAPATGETGGTDRHFVPHFLPGSNTEALTEWITKGGLITGGARNVAVAEDWIPLAAARGGVKTLYPEYRSTLTGVNVDSAKVAALTVPSLKSSISAAKVIADESPRDGEVHVLPVQGNVYMLVVDGTNVTASVGTEGVALVNTGSRQMADKVLEAVKQLSGMVSARATANACIGATCPGPWGWSSPYMNAVIASPAAPRPIRYIINTSAAPEHTGGNEKIVAAGTGLRGGQLGGAVANVEGAPVIAHENVLSRMSAPAGKQPPTPEAAWPTATYGDELTKLPTYFNGEGVVVYHEPAASTDGDSIVMFRRSEVISAGSIFSTVSYPVIDVEKGGTVQGVIRGLNHILDLAVAEYRSQGGTWIIPGRGRLSDTADVASYRNMVVIIRDRVQDLIGKGMTLAQIKAARPSLDFDGRYGSTTGPWSTDMFVEAVYRSLQNKK
jgi:glyoxylase-like metal-dependent hydrolase (beta-lactamase superfamily II)